MSEQFELTLEIQELIAGKESKPINHHLRRKKSGLWQLRITVDRGRKYVGKRVIMGLDTRNVNEARARRDLVLKALDLAMKVSSETTARMPGN